MKVKFLKFTFRNALWTCTYCTSYPALTLINDIICVLNSMFYVATKIMAKFRFTSKRRTLYVRHISSQQCIFNFKNSLCHAQIHTQNKTVKTYERKFYTAILFGVEIFFLCKIFMTFFCLEANLPLFYFC